MIAKNFSKRQPPADAPPMIRAGWEAEQDAAFRIDRAFGELAQRKVRIFHDIRLPATFASGEVRHGDFFQIDHLVLHCHGAAIIESKSVAGELNVDRLGQWQRRWSGKATNISSPVTQAQQQCVALRRLFQSASRELLDKVLGIVLSGFGEFPATPYVVIGSKGRLTGATAPFENTVMKVDQVVERVTKEIERHRSRSGLMGIVRSVVAGDGEMTVFDLTDEELNRIEKLLLERHTPLVHNASKVSVVAAREHRAPQPAAIAGAGNRVEQLESLSCSKCKSASVQLIHARNYCLKCVDCGQFSPLKYSCPRCEKHASIRKQGPEFYRDCDGSGGCGTQTVFWRAKA